MGQRWQGSSLRMNQIFTINIFLLDYTKYTQKVVLFILSKRRVSSYLYLVYAEVLLRTYTKYEFGESLDFSQIKPPLTHSKRLSGGKSF